MAEVNWDSPCERAIALRKAFYELIGGKAAYQITYIANGVQRQVSYSVVDKQLLLAEIRRAEDECADLNGEPRKTRRFAMVGGALRRRFEG